MKIPTTFPIATPKLLLGGAMTVLMLSGCGPTGAGGTASDSLVTSSSTPSQFKIYLPDGSGGSALSGMQAKAGGGNSKSEISDVFVQFDRIELRSEGDRTLVESQIERTVSLLHHFDLFEGTAGISQVLSEIREIRLHISDTGSYLVKSSGELCALKVPSGNQSGLKLKFADDFSLEPNHLYELEVIFDIDHSIVLQGNGGCLLKPVLRARIHNRGPITPPDSDTTPPDSGTTTPDSGTTTDGNSTYDSEVGWVSDAPTIVEVVP